WYSQPVRWYRISGRVVQLNRAVCHERPLFTIEGILTAYKLFYVGCSRARKNLIIVVDENRIAQFKDAFIGKVKKIGFSVQ
ncbi:hypothetical protein, partial [Eubacterium sp. ER2]|uniref:hypothetical protein n=1 Tax=Eubacterium sp. ER2 TaxID=1519438 RepID=UPI0019D3932A